MSKPKRSDTDARRLRGEAQRARREMAAFDALPPEVQRFVQTANGGWRCVELRKRIAKAKTAKGMWWGVERLLAQYRQEDAAA